jgi:hypothetical protein
MDNNIDVEVSGPLDNISLKITDKNTNSTTVLCVKDVYYIEHRLQQHINKIKNESFSAWFSTRPEDTEFETCGMCSSIVGFLRDGEWDYWDGDCCNKR